MGLEALSRGAEFVTFVERDRGIGATLRKNIERAGFSGESRVVQADAFARGAPVDSAHGRHDLVFVDPPYAETHEAGQGSRLGGLMAVLEGQAAAGGIVVVRTHQSSEPVDRYGVFEVIERRKWGTMLVTILRKGDR